MTDRAALRATGMTSPFAPVLEPFFLTLPVALREQFFVVPSSSDSLVLTGRMERVWRHHQWLRPFFLLLARADILFPETGYDVPASLTVTGHVDRFGQPYQRWCRTFSFPTPRRFNATMAYDGRRRRVVERLGPAGMVQMQWEVRFDGTNRLHIVGERAELRVMNFCLRLPSLLAPTVRAIEEADAATDDLIHIDLTVTHRLLGPIFGYNGVFRLQRQPVVEGNT